jgi:hypothetical protein
MGLAYRAKRRIERHRRDSVEFILSCKSQEGSEIESSASGLKRDTKPCLRG